METEMGDCLSATPPFHPIYLNNIKAFLSLYLLDLTAFPFSFAFFQYCLYAFLGWYGKWYFSDGISQR